MKLKLGAILFALIFGATACTFTATRSNQTTETPKSADNKTEDKKAETKSGEKTDKDTQTAVTAENKSSGDKSACLTAKMDGKKLIKDQTFVFDHEPFPKSCFVTFASKEDMVDDSDVPRGSTFHIYEPKNGIVYDFPDAFDGMEACWVEGVGFQDLNGDGKMDVIIAGRCLGNKDSYPQNAIYENHNDDFRTFASQNENLNDLKTVKEIAEYVKKHKDQFFDN